MREEAQTVFLKRKYYLDEVEAKELYTEICDEASENREARRAMEKKNAAELARKRDVENFQENSTTIEMLHKLINQS